MRIVLGICGGIAAYKTPELVRLLRKQGHSVTCVLTNSALNFVSKLSLEVVSESKVFLDSDRFSSESIHLKLVNESDALVIVPATANSLAKFAYGLADDLLSTLVVSYTKPKLLVPAMHTEMWENPAVVQNIDRLLSMGFLKLGPIVGDLACGDFGVGRLVDLDVIVDRIALLSRPLGSLVGKKLIVTAGGTFERLDSVRAITNFSSGKLGRSIARVARFMGADVTLITTSSVSDPFLNQIVVASSGMELSRELDSRIDECDALVMSAAVSDFRPVNTRLEKIRRSEGLVLELEATEDILKSMASKKGDKVYIGFCLVDSNLKEEALKKLTSKNLDFIVANTSEMFGKDYRDILIFQSGKEDPIVQLSSQTLLNTAYEILSRCLVVSAV